LTGIDAITFTSGSTVRGFVQALKKANLPSRSALNGAKVIAIGPETAKALKAAGIRRFHLPRGSWTVEGLVSTLVEVMS
jgi:uroporphyrinogen-III synthase